MVTTRLGIAAICAVLAAASAAAQNNPVAPLVSADIIRIIGSDGDARDVIAHALADAAHNRRVTFVLASQIRRDWRPVMKDVDVVRLPDTAIGTFLSDCGRYWIIADLQRTGNVIKLRLEQKCGCTSRDYTASLKGNVWSVSMNGVGCGCGGPQPPDCPCLFR
jgi:hypothetical protein